MLLLENLTLSKLALFYVALGLWVSYKYTTYKTLTTRFVFLDKIFIRTIISFVHDYGIPKYSPFNLCIIQQPILSFNTVFKPMAERFKYVSLKRCLKRQLQLVIETRAFFTFVFLPKRDVAFYYLFPVLSCTKTVYRNEPSTNFPEKADRQRTHS